MHVTDKMLIGGRVAFDADASVWRTVVSGSVPELGQTWVPEQLHTAHLVRIARARIEPVPIAFCILSIAVQSARFPSSGVILEGVPVEWVPMGDIEENGDNG